MPELPDIYNFLPLSDNLFTSGQPTRPQFPLLAAAGVQSVINLAVSTSSNALPDEEAVVRSLRLEYTHIPVVWENPTRADLERFFQAMEAAAGKKLLVHCAANMRVSAFIALYRILQLGWDRQKALQDTYRIWDPGEDPVWGKFFDQMAGKMK